MQRAQLAPGAHLVGAPRLKEEARIQGADLVAEPDAEERGILPEGKAAEEPSTSHQRRAWVSRGVNPMRQRSRYPTRGDLRRFS